MLCDDLDGWDGAGRSTTERRYTHTYTHTHTHTHTRLIHFVSQQKLTQHCKAITIENKEKCSCLGDCGHQQ